MTTNNEDQEMVLVPRIPTKAMLDAAYYEAMDENAEGVWEKMIGAWNQERMVKSDSGKP
jgi:hypothetical protein